jgi:two-component system response regulator ArlR
MLYEIHPDLIIMSSGLPAIKGEEATLRVRQASCLPMIMMGSRDEALDLLETGADAVLTRPPDQREMLARVYALLRRKQRPDPPDPDISLGTTARTGTRKSGTSGLTPTEFRLASCLWHNRGRMVTNSRLMEEAWGGKEINLETLHFYLRRLKRKLENFTITGERGMGFFMDEDCPHFPGEQEVG